MILIFELNAIIFSVLNRWHQIKKDDDDDDVILD